MFSKPFINTVTGRPSKFSRVLAPCSGEAQRSSLWRSVPRDGSIDFSKVYRWSHYMTNINYAKWGLREKEDSKFSYDRCFRQAVKAFFGEMMTWYILDNGDNSLLPDWYTTPDHLWSSMRVNWRADHLSNCNTAIEDKTKNVNDPGIVLQYSSSDRITRRSANCHPILTGNVGPNYFLNILEHRNVNGDHQYRIAAIVRGIDVYYNRDFEYCGRKLVGPMKNDNEHKRQLTLEVLRNCPGIKFYAPQRAVKPRRVSFGENTVIEIENICTGPKYKFDEQKKAEEMPEIDFGYSSP